MGIHGDGIVRVLLSLIWGASDVRGFGTRVECTDEFAASTKRTVRLKLLSSPRLVILTASDVDDAQRVHAKTATIDRSQSAEPKSGTRWTRKGIRRWERRFTLIADE